MRSDRGQGLNHAICDASNFVAAMQKVVDGSVALKDAITEYSEEVVQRGANEVVISKETAISFLDWDRLMNSPLMKKSVSRV
jgi:hypothetical protein